MHTASAGIKSSVFQQRAWSTDAREVVVNQVQHHKGISGETEDAFILVFNNIMPLGTKCCLPPPLYLMCTLIINWNKHTLLLSCSPGNRSPKDILVSDLQLKQVVAVDDNLLLHFYPHPKLTMWKCHFSILCTSHGVGKKAFPIKAKHVHQRDPVRCNQQTPIKKS